MDTAVTITGGYDLRALDDHLRSEGHAITGCSGAGDQVTVHSDAPLTGLAASVASYTYAAPDPVAAAKAEAIKVFTNPGSGNVSQAALHFAMKSMSVVTKREFVTMKAGNPRASQSIAALIAEAIQAIQNDETE